VQSNALPSLRNAFKGWSTGSATGDGPTEKRSYLADFHMIATIAAIAGKNVHQSL